MKNKYSETAEIFKAFCDENRIRILEILQTGEKCGCKLLEELNVTQPTLSHHMKILCDSGIVDSRKEGKWTHYKISSKGRNDIIKLLEEITEISCSCPDNCCN
ncbi:MAG: ArsR/SmtB family transcription factor [Monoglobaceae bacterium]